MMSGNKIKIIAALFLAGFLLGKLKSNSFKNNLKPTNDKPNVAQYLNRLSEFFFDDLDEAKSDFFELLDMGFSSEDCFQITIAKKALT